MLRQMDIKKLSFKAAEYLPLWVETLRKCLANVESLEIIWILNQCHSLRFHTSQADDKKSYIITEANSLKMEGVRPFFPSLMDFR